MLEGLQGRQGLGIGCSIRKQQALKALAHVIEQAYVLDCAPQLPNRQAIKPARRFALPYLNLQRLRNEAVRQALAATRGHKGRAAKLLGVHANTMTRLLGQLPEDAEHRDSTATDASASHN